MSFWALVFLVSCHFMATPVCLVWKVHTPCGSTGSGGPRLGSGLFVLQKVLYKMLLAGSENTDSRGNSMKNNALVFRAACEGWKMTVLLSPLPDPRLV